MMGEIFCFSENTLYKDSNLYNVFSAYYTPGYVNTYNRTSNFYNNLLKGRKVCYLIDANWGLMIPK